MATSINKSEIIMKSKYYITNEIAVHYNFTTELSRTNEDRQDDNTFLMAAPILEGLPECGTAVYLSTNGDPVLIGVWNADNENTWSIFDDESAEDSTEEYPNTAGYMDEHYNIDHPDDIESLMVKAGLFK